MAAMSPPVPPGVRLLASDLDGTLLLPDGSVGARTRDALDALDASEVDLVIVTGRPPRWIAPIVAMTGHRGVGIGANGAVVVDLADGHLTEVFPIPADDALAVIDRLRWAMPGLVFAVERARVGGRLSATAGRTYADLDAVAADVTEFALGSGYIPRWPIPEGTLVAPIEELVAAGDTVKILARPGEHIVADADAFWAAGGAAIASVAEVTHSNPADRLLEISARGVSKATTLARVAAARGWDSDDVVAVGDAPNDLPMLAWAGTAYAVANAHPAVIATADHVLPGNADEGVAGLIDALVAQSRADHIR